jgi:hypothetical protein
MTAERLQLVVSVKRWLVTLTALTFVGCATPNSEWNAAGYYVANGSVYGCDSFESKKGTVMKQTAILSLSLQRRLLALLEHAVSADEALRRQLDEYRDHLMCWYETPEKDVELTLGALCDSPLEIVFHSQGGEWYMASAERAIVECQLPNTSPVHTHER